MQWYKKQLDNLLADKKTDQKKESGKKANTPPGKKLTGHFFAAAKAPVKTKFGNPVAQRNQNRPKTDSK